VGVKPFAKVYVGRKIKLVCRDTGRCGGMEMNAEKCKVIISRQPSLVEIMIVQKQMENVQYFNYSGSMIANDARCTREITLMSVIANATFSKKTFSLAFMEKKKNS
jgi:hypothetical protein